MAQVFHDTIEIPVAGGPLLVAAAGAPAGPDMPVVLAVHGITGSHRSWSPVVRNLGTDISVLAPDLRGRGGSAALPPPYGMAAHVADLLAVLDHFGVRRAVLAGHSMGAYVATRLAAAAPDRVSAAVLVDGGPALPRPAGIDADTLLAAVLGPALDRLSMTFDSSEAYRDFWRAHPAFATAWEDDLVREDIADYVDYDLTDTPPLRSRVAQAPVRADGRDLLDPEATGKALAALACPATLLWAPRGLQDEDRPLLSAEVIMAAQEALPQLTVRQVPDTNHYLILLRDRDARAVAAAIRELALF
ncbi:MAG TPA: alpha/beta fold hydrolase [Sporichthyaceae bacterium]|nr:alpha/beta fold hydrolase [Sporichthyaceae bacterium]